MKVFLSARFFLWCLVPQILAEDEVVESTVKTCEVDECIRQDACPYFAAVVTDLEELGLDTKEYNETLAVVKQSVCNQEEQGVCCADFEDQISIRSLVRRGEKCCKECFYQIRTKRCKSRRDGRRCRCGMRTQKPRG